MRGCCAQVGFTRPDRVPAPTFRVCAATSRGLFASCGWPGSGPNAPCPDPEVGQPQSLTEGPRARPAKRPVWSRPGLPVAGSPLGVSASAGRGAAPQPVSRPLVPSQVPATGPDAAPKAGARRPARVWDQSIAQSVIRGGRGCCTGAGAGGCGAVFTGGIAVACFIVCSIYAGRVPFWVGGSACRILRPGFVSSDLLSP